MSSSQFNKGPSYGLSAEVKNRVSRSGGPVPPGEGESGIGGERGLSAGLPWAPGDWDEQALAGCISPQPPWTVPPHPPAKVQKLPRVRGTGFCGLALDPATPAPVSDGSSVLVERVGGLGPPSFLTIPPRQAKTKGMQSGVDIGVKYSEKQQRNFDEAKMKAGQCVIGLQMGTNKCASQSGMTAYGTRRHLYDPKNQILPPMDHSTISLQMGTNKCASQVGMTAPGTRRHIYDAKMGTEKCDNSSMSLQMGSNQGANQSGQVFGLGRQIYDPKYCPQGSQGEVANATCDQSGDPPGYHYYCEEEESY
uniref:Calponin 2 n=1 Tax=Falco tinnunculus TaxID=100819 RepID=A0A8C4UY34_FALTI